MMTAGTVGTLSAAGFALFFLPDADSDSIQNYKRYQEN